ncbi:hypothetical protein ASPVEDRAFT_143825 [Aspergillus versicolor CBS 583.65]|uniref:Rhodopsin domain-containing protein n=1 Tax=Aspergillus versicolor CBS 583.65 TaxID=1036611 RepID=A0A1L9Q332_ASPVE|nr:uncharacterized protein ASPVEDRAFT_143825 [Aspergillus versicolor CBS 583.65]OJJ08150.1 hypothetical protein ASPVEDRAFT_143825 [Aspergillus versicolor CBS 583.65]
MGPLTTRSLESGSRQASVFGVGGAFVAFISAVIAARVYVRVVMLHALGTDDVLMVIGSVSLVYSTEMSRLTGIAAYYGVGRHVNDIPNETMVPMLKSVYSTRVIYVLSLGFVKVSLLIFYLRLDHRRYMKWIVYGLQFVVVGLTIASFFVLAFSCFPPAKFWDLTGETEGKCMDVDSQQVFYEANGILNIITDICIYLAPIPMLWGVRISTVSLFGVFGLGILSIAAGCVRYDFVKKLAHNPDQYYSLADSLNWCSIEIYVAIFCGSAPSLSVLVKTYAPALLGSSGRTGNSHGHPSGPGGTYRLSSRPTNRRRLSDTIDLNGSQDNIIAGQGRSEGIMMKTDIHLEVNDADSTPTRQDHFRFGK